MATTSRLDPRKKTEAYAVDVASAIVAACTVAPGIKIVDQGMFYVEMLIFFDYYIDGVLVINSGDGKNSQQQHIYFQCGNEKCEIDWPGPKEVFHTPNLLIRLPRVQWNVYHRQYRADVSRICAERPPCRQVGKYHAGQYDIGYFEGSLFRTGV